MKIIFTKAGKYKNGIRTVEISNEDVKTEKVFEIVDKNALSYIDARKAQRPGYKKDKDKDKK